MELTKIERNPQTHPAKDYTLNLDDGLRDIQKQSGSVWTHFNDSDPGVTIYQQLVYGMVDIGYRSGFSMNDLLTEKSGKMRLRGQFHDPGDVLGTTAVTVSDYRMLLLDRFDELKNVWIEPAQSRFLPRGFYRVLLELRDDLKERYFTDGNLSSEGKDGEKAKVDAEKSLATLREKVAKALNGYRNLCECFLAPIVLRPKPVYLGGSIHLTRDCDVKAFVEEIAFQIQSRIFPSVRMRDYRQMKDEGFEMEDIFDGPQMNVGFIDHDDLIERQQTVFLDDIASRFSDIEGLSYLSDTHFTSEDGQRVESDRITAAYDEVLFFPDILKTKLSNGYRIKLIKNGIPVDLTALKLGEGGYANNQQYIKSIAVNRRTHQDLDPPKPQGTFRDIESYSSIQDTFPPNYGVGETDFFKTATELRKAQSKQLRGFLFIFEQLLGNAFSQLANIHKLFSFGDNESVDGSDGSRRKSSKQIAAKMNLWRRRQEGNETYFSQPLYGVPGAADLLRGVEKFACAENASSKEAIGDAFEEYKNDPYNSYRIGLEKFTRLEARDLDRKKRFLDHQLARLGESLTHEEKMMINSDQALFEVDEIQRRSRFLNSYPELSSQRSKGRELPFKERTEAGVEDQKSESSAESSPEKAASYEASGFEKKLNCILQVSEFYRDICESIVVRARDENNAIADSFDLTRVEVWRVIFSDGGQVSRKGEEWQVERVPLKDKGPSVYLDSTDSLVSRLNAKKLIATPGQPYLVVLSEGQFVLLFEDDGGTCQRSSSGTGDGQSSEVWNLDYVKTKVLQYARSLQNLSERFEGFVFVETTPILQYEKYCLKVRVKSIASEELFYYRTELASLDTVYRIANVMEDDGIDCAVSIAGPVDRDRSSARIRLERERLNVRFLNADGIAEDRELSHFDPDESEVFADEWKGLDGSDGEFLFDLKLEAASSAFDSFSTCDSDFPMGVHLFFPNWVSRFAESSMRQYLEDWTCRNLPVHIRSKISFVGLEDMAMLLESYDKWFNCIEEGCREIGDTKEASRRESNEGLLRLIDRFSQTNPDRSGDE